MNISTATDYLFYYHAIVNYNCVCVYATYDELLFLMNYLFEPIVGPFPREICKSLEYFYTRTKADIYDSRTMSHFIWQDSSNSDMHV